MHAVWAWRTTIAFYSFCCLRVQVNSVGYATPVPLSGAAPDFRRPATLGHQTTPVPSTLTASVGPQQSRTFSFFRFVYRRLDSARHPSELVPKPLDPMRNERSYANAAPHSPDTLYSCHLAAPQCHESCQYIRRPLVTIFSPKCSYRRVVRLRVRSSNSFTSA